MKRNVIILIIIINIAIILYLYGNRLYANYDYATMSTDGIKNDINGVSSSPFYGQNASRGFRNNNPFNIVINKSNNWVGKLESKDPKFEQFANMAYGVRAGLRLLNTYLSKGYDTLEKITPRYVPITDNNNPTAYALKVSQQTNIPIDKKLSSKDLITIGRAFIMVENGKSLPDILYTSGVKLSGF